MQVAGRPVEDDTSAADWIAGAVRDGGTVASLVPPVFEAYARVFHPAYRYDGDDDLEVSWADVAAHNGTLAHPLMQWPGITGGWQVVHDDDQSPVWHREPDEGHLPIDLAARLVSVLRRHTTTPENCWFCVWNGFGWTAESAPSVALPGRELWLLRGSLELATANLAPEPSEQSVNLWWPADRSWCVATDIDLMSTYVGGSADCISALLDATELEAARAAAQTPIDLASDQLNPVPPRR